MNVLMLLIAVTFNIVVSVSVSAFVISWLQKNVDFQQERLSRKAFWSRNGRVSKGKLMETT